ncbi:MobP2 family relaxase [Staphylococcus aureus]|uniref:MobP2 family relaxase n=1 Tax=Staphylococcus aureus TaxID=1280 RepID=UPI000920A0B0|nr:MobP2 family relaxase [Staphylococcus aureus]SGT77986.1 Uncharacterised protein [Staphylococcus aureus]
MPPAIILKTQFSTSKFGGYLKYISDEKNGENKIDNSKLQYLNQEIETVNNGIDKFNLNSYSSYIMGYMKNNSITKKSNTNKKKVVKRTTAPFNNTSNKLQPEELKKLKEDFDEAEKRGSINYQDIISFDNAFLIKNNLYNPETDELNEDVIKKATIRMMNRMIKDENMNPHKTRWMANIHYDTDNIHIHISTTELKNTRKVIINEKGIKEIKGKRRKKTLENMKSSFSNSLLDSTKLLENITKYRNDLYYNFKIKTEELDTLLSIKNLKKRLPVCNKDWQYNNKEVKHLQIDIDKITSNVVKKNYIESYKQYVESVKNVADFYVDIYGEGSKALNYIDNKRNELNQRLGNKLLKELKKNNQNYKRKERITRNIYKHSNRNADYKNRIIAKTNNVIVTRSDLYKIDKAINDEAKAYLNQLEFVKLQRKIEMENNH